MKINPLPSLDYLRECFEFDSTCISGLRWKVRPKKHFPTSKGWAVFKNYYANKAAGFLWTSPRDGKQYFRIGISGVEYFVHRIIYSLHHNIELSVDFQIDHNDNNGLNNHPDNLRRATHNENKHNEKLRKSNTSNHKGVYFRKDRGNWYGRISHHSKNYSVGCSPSKEIIIELVRELRQSLHKEFTNHG